MALFSGWLLLIPCAHSFISSNKVVSINSPCPPVDSQIFACKLFDWCKTVAYEHLNWCVRLHLPFSSVHSLLHHQVSGYKRRWHLNITTRCGCGALDITLLWYAPRVSSTFVTRQQRLRLHSTLRTLIRSNVVLYRWSGRVEVRLCHFHMVSSEISPTKYCKNLIDPSANTSLLGFPLFWYPPLFPSVSHQNHDIYCWYSNNCLLMGARQKIPAKRKQCWYKKTNYGTGLKSWWWSMDKTSRRAKTPSSLQNFRVLIDHHTRYQLVISTFEDLMKWWSGVENHMMRVE